MYILMISRGIPSKRYPQWGCFEKDQAEALASIGHKVIVMSVDVSPRLHRGRLGLHHCVINGVEYYNYVVVPAILLVKIIGYDSYINKIKFNYYRKVFNKIVKEHGKPDIIYTQFYWNTVMGVKLKEISGVPVVGIEHLSNFNEGTLSKRDYKWAAFAFNRVDSLISVSESLANNIYKKFKIKSSIIPNILGSEFLNASLPDRKSDNPFIFVAVGSLIKRKAFDILIQAFSKLNVKNCHLHIIGDGPEKKQLQDKIKILNLSHCIKLMGKMTKHEIVNKLLNSNAFVLPSRCETFGVVYIEALSLGLPNIATICGGPEKFINKSNGLLIKPDDIDGLTKAMLYIYNNYSNYNPQIIRNNCLAKFSQTAVGEQITNDFQKVINKRKY